MLRYLILVSEELVAASDSPREAITLAELYRVDTVVLDSVYNNIIYRTSVSLIA